MVDTYITSADLESSLRDLSLEQIAENITDGNTADAILEAKRQAMGLAQNYLTRYDLETEWHKTGVNRNYGLVFHLKNICLYIIYQRVEGDEMPEHVLKNYQDSIESLEKISKGKIEFDLPLKQIDTDGDGEVDSDNVKFRYGGETPRSI